MFDKLRDAICIVMGRKVATSGDRVDGGWPPMPRPFPPPPKPPPAPFDSLTEINRIYADVERLSPSAADQIRTTLLEIEQKLDAAGLNGREEVCKLWYGLSRPVCVLTSPERCEFDGNLLPCPHHNYSSVRSSG